MKRKITILSAFMMCTFNISNVINYKDNTIQQTNNEFIKENITLKSQNYLELDINDVITSNDTDFKNCTVEFWFASMSLKKKLKIGYDAWTNYFGPMIQKLDAYIFKYPVSTTSAGKIKIALINMFAKVIKYKFWKGGNDTDSNPPYWDGYQIAASYILANKDYLHNFFNDKGTDAFFATEYWDNNCFLNKEELEALGVSTIEEVDILCIEKFNLPWWFPILKTEIWNIDQDLFYYEKTSIWLNELDGKIEIHFRFGDETIENLKKSLDKYSALDKIPHYSGWIALAFCTMLQQKILNESQISETMAMQLATYIYKYRDEADIWNILTIVHIEENFYWFEEEMTKVYESEGSNFDAFKVLKEWPL